MLNYKKKIGIPSPSSFQHLVKGLVNIRTALRIRPEEAGIVTAFLAFSWFLGVAKAVDNSTSKGLFLGAYDAQMVPYVYIGSAVVVTLIGIVYLKLQQTISLGKLLVLNLSLNLVIMLGIRFLMSVTTARWPTMLYAIWFDVEFTLVNMAFWGLANRVFSMQQGKRLFSLLGAGGSLAAVASGLFIKWYSQFGSAKNLLFFSIGGLVGALLILLLILRKYGSELEEPEEAGSSTSQSHASEHKTPIWKSPYILLLCGLAILGDIGYMFMDNIFLDGAKGQYTTAEELSGFMGTFFAIVAAGSFLVRTLLSGFFITRYGLGITLLLLPAAMLLGTLAIVTTGVFAEVPTAIFWLICLTTFLDRTIRYTLDSSAILVLYQPLRPEQRTQMYTLVESIVMPLEAVVTGGILLLLNQWLGFGGQELAWILLGVLGGWITIVFFLRKEYLRMLVKAVSLNRYDGTELSLHDPATRKILEERLGSQYPEEVIYSLHVLANIDHPIPDSTFHTLLSHPVLEVRQTILEMIEEQDLREFSDMILVRAVEDPSMVFRNQALRSLGVLHEEVEDHLNAYLESEQSELQSGAIVGLMRSGQITAIVSAGTILSNLVASDKFEDRVNAANILEQINNEGFYRTVQTLMGDPHYEVRAAAIRTAGKLGHPKLWPTLVGSLGVKELRYAATQALEECGDSVVDTLERAFENTFDEYHRIQIAKLCGNLGTPRASKALVSWMDFPDEDVRHAIFKALKKCSYHAMGPHVESIQQVIRSEVEDAVWAMAAMRDVGEGPEVHLLRRALEEEVYQNRERVFILLSFIYDSKMMTKAWRGLDSEIKGQRSYALEIVETLIAVHLKELVVPLFEDIDWTERLDKLSNFFPQETMLKEERLREIIVRSEKWTTTWTQCCSVYLAGALQLDELTHEVGNLLKSDHPLVRETAIWALAQLNPSDLLAQLTPLFTDTDETVSLVARHVVHLRLWTDKTH